MSEYNFSFTVRGSLTLGLEGEEDDEDLAFATATEALEAIALGNTIYPITDYVIDQKPDVYLASTQELQQGEQEQGKRHIDLTPTPQGYRAMRRMFEEQQQDSQEILLRIEEMRGLFDEFEDNPKTTAYYPLTIKTVILNRSSLLRGALDAYETQERKRIADMQDGLDELAKGGY